MARLPRLPDLLTTANLACGVGSILLASQGQLTWACWLVFAGAVFDVFDGLAARALGQGGSEFGKQLDSLADVVTFGVAPGMVMFQWGTGNFLSFGQGSWMVWVGACLIPIASAWRLAKFNIDPRQTSGFLGLPTPANALFWASLFVGLDNMLIRDVYGVEYAAVEVKNALPEHVLLIHKPYVLLGISIILGSLMLSELPLPSLKFKHFKWKGNETIYILAVSGLALVLLYGILAVPLILLLYLLSPLWGKLFPKTTPTSPGSTGSP